jgi:hypothetical protein
MYNQSTSVWPDGPLNLFMYLYTVCIQQFLTYSFRMDTVMFHCEDFHTVSVSPTSLTDE